MKIKRKNLSYTVLITLIIGIAFFVAWQKLMVVHEPVLDTSYYKFELDTIRTQRTALAKEKPDYKKAKSQFVANITKKIFPYWHGAKWDFNGTTKIPGEGAIACGYFVTTTLEHMGVPINRVKMAQCASEEMIQSLTTKKNIHHLSNIPLKEFEKRLKKFGNGLYIIGLDNHTGYIFLSDNGNFFIHSTGWFPFKVVKDKLSESRLIGKSKYRVVGKISDDETFLKKWLAAK